MPSLRHLLLTLSLPVAAFASAGPALAEEVHDDLTSCLILGPPRPVSAEARGGYTAAAAGVSRTDGAAAAVALTLEGGASVWSGTHDCAQAQELAIDASVTPRWEGPGPGAGATMAASLRYGAAPHRDPDHAILNWLPTTWELGYAGDLARRPGLSDRADLARDVFDRFAVTIGTRGFRIETADVCGPDDHRQHCVEGKGPTTPQSLAIDLGAFDSELALVDQDTRRVEQEFAGALMRVALRERVHAQVDLLRLDVDRTQIGDVVSELWTVWPIRLDTTNPDTGTRYVIGYGMTDFQIDGLERPRVRTHRDRAVGGVGATFGPGPRGAGFGWLRDAYLTMAAEPVLDDRLTAEGWVTVRGHALRARAFASRMERLEPAPMQAPVVWTAGGELGARRTVRGFDVDAMVEAGRSYYAVLDGAAPQAGLGARAQLTIARRGSRTIAP